MRRPRGGQALIEYLPIVALTAIVVTVALVLMGKQIAGAFQNVADLLRGP